MPFSFKDFFRKAGRRGRPANEPHRDTLAWPNLNSLGQSSPAADRIVYKPVPKNLRYFSRTPIARRAINSIKSPIAQLEWEIVPKPGVKMNSELERQIEVATTCFDLPNSDDNFTSMTQQVVEDVLVGAGAIEIGKSGDKMRPLWLWPVDGLSIQLMPGWAGGTHEARYLQTIGYGSYSVGSGQGVMLRNDELMYIRPNPTTATPFGFGPLEIAFNSIARQLTTGEFAGKLAGNALPPFMIDLGEVTGNVVRTWRSYWTNEVEGEGKIPIIGTELTQGAGTAGGKTRGPNAIRLYPEGDKALYLAYQEFLRTEIAAGFDLCNMNLNVERDVNRSTAEVQEDRDWLHAIRPMALLLAAHWTREALWGTLGFYSLMFKWKGIDRKDEKSECDILCALYDRNVYTPNQIRDKLGEPPLDPTTADWGNKLKADVDIAMKAAQGAKVVDDPDLKAGSPAVNPQPAPSKDD
jgi:hypothetical protein